VPDALVTATELAIHNDWPDATYPADRAQQAIYHATAMVQAETGQRLVAVAGDVVTLWAARPAVRLPQRPVTAVTAVTTAAGTVYTNGAGTDWTLVGDWLTVGTWMWSRGYLTVTYSHGYATVPEQLKWVCLAAATRLLDNPGALRSAATGGESVTWSGAADDVGPGLSAAERAALGPWRELLVA